MYYKLLLIDDEESILNMLKKNFEMEDYVVYTAAISAAALERLRCGPDLILLDINMPGMDGLDFCALIREHISCPILFLAARVAEQDKVSGLMAGGDDYMKKHFVMPSFNVPLYQNKKRKKAFKCFCRFCISGLDTYFFAMLSINAVMSSI